MQIVAINFESCDMKNVYVQLLVERILSVENNFLKYLFYSITNKQDAKITKNVK